MSIKLLFSELKQQGREEATFKNSFCPFFNLQCTYAYPDTNLWKDNKVILPHKNKSRGIKDNTGINFFLTDQFCLHSAYHVYLTQFFLLQLKEKSEKEEDGEADGKTA